MKLLKKLFSTNKIKSSDSDFGEIEGRIGKNNIVIWRFNHKFLDTNIEILLSGNLKGIDTDHKLIFQNALKNEDSIKDQSEKALKIQFDNAGIKFISMDMQFYLNSMIIYDNGFEIAFQEIDRENHIFNVHFENNKEVGVSIDS